MAPRYGAGRSYFAAWGGSIEDEGGAPGLHAPTPKLTLTLHLCVQALDGKGISDADLLSNFGLKREQPSSEAKALIDYVVSQHSDFLDKQFAGGKAKLLKAYATMAVREETLMVCACIWPLGVIARIR